MSFSLSKEHAIFHKTLYRYLRIVLIPIIWLLYRIQCWFFRVVICKYLQSVIVYPNTTQTILLLLESMCLKNLENLDHFCTVCWSQVIFLGEWSCICFSKGKYRYWRCFNFSLLILMWEFSNNHMTVCTAGGNEFSAVSSVRNPFHWAKPGSFTDCKQWFCRIDKPSCHRWDMWHSSILFLALRILPVFSFKN